MCIAQDQWFSAIGLMPQNPTSALMHTPTHLCSSMAPVSLRRRRRWQAARVSSVACSWELLSTCREGEGREGEGGGGGVGGSSKHNVTLCVWLSIAQ
jgi:hypothetical protein